MRFNRLAGEKEFPNLRQACRRALVVTIAADAHPHRVFVQLDVLLLCSAKHHSAQAAVADGQRLVPFDGGLVVPEPGARGVRRFRLADGGIRSRPGHGRHGSQPQSKKIAPCGWATCVGFHDVHFRRVLFHFSSLALESNQAPTASDQSPVRASHLRRLIPMRPS